MRMPQKGLLSFTTWAAYEASWYAYWIKQALYFFFNVSGGFIKQMRKKMS